MSSSNKTTSKYISNPVHVNQLVGIEVTGDCVLDLNTECGTLNQYLQFLVDKACAPLNVNVDCLDVAEVNLENVLQALINKVCNELVTIPNETGTGDTSIDLSSVNLALGSNWDCDSDIPLITDPCGTEPTNEEIIQSLVSRLIDYGNLIQTHCEKIEALEALTITLQQEIAANNCC